MPKYDNCCLHILWFLLSLVCFYSADLAAALLFLIVFFSKFW